MIRQSGFFAFVKSGKTYKRVFETPLFSSCGFVDNNGEIHNSYKLIVDQMSCDTPLFHKSPNNGNIAFLNVSVRGDGCFAFYPAIAYNIGASFSSNKNKVNLARVSTVIGFQLGKN